MNKMVLMGVLIILVFGNSMNQASLIIEERIVIYRSQFRQSDINIDGSIEEGTEWLNAGSELILLDNGNITRNLNLKFVNDDVNLYFGVKLDVENFIYASFAILFDVEGDGILSSPEDGKVMTTNNTKVTDFHWDGEEWTEDISDPNSNEFIFAKKINSDSIQFEFSISLLSNYIQYDGLQIPSTSNAFIAFTTQFQIIEGNQTNFYAFPTSANNVSAYVDLKLAGPEAQELQDYEPDQVFTDVADPVDVFEVLGMDAEAPVITSAIFIGLIVATILVTKRRRT